MRRIALIVAGLTLLAGCREGFDLASENTPPDVVLDASPRSGPGPLTVTFSGFASDLDGSVVSYELDFGDGSPLAPGPNGQHTYDPPTASLKMFEKDLSVIGDDLRRLGLDVPLFDAVDALYKEASAALPETHDTAAVFEVYRKRRP